jgi:hypothetical protein
MKIGRRVPRNFLKSLAYKTAGFLSFQENIWLIIGRSLVLAKNACDAHPEEQIKITIQNKDEDEDLYYKIQWKIMTISSIYHDKEVEEYNAAMKLYDNFSMLKTMFNKKIDDNPDFKRAFKSKVMTEQEFNKAKEAGYGAIENKTISSQLLELGIITDISTDWSDNK